MAAKSLSTVSGSYLVGLPFRTKPECGATHAMREMSILLSRSDCRCQRGFTDQSRAILAVDSQLDRTVMDVLPHEPKDPRGRLCQVIAWPRRPIITAAVLNPAARQMAGARLSLRPMKFGTLH
jgi:hypothetical protein